MDDTISMDQLDDRYDAERTRHPAEPPLDTAARVFAWAGDRLDRDDACYLVDWACSAFARGGIPPELRLSPRTVTLIDRDPPWDDSDLLAAYPTSDRAPLLAAGWVEWERFFAPRDDEIDVDRLYERYRSEREHHPAEPPLDTATRLLTWADDRLDGETVQDLAMSADSAFRRDGVPPELRLSPRTVTLIERRDRPPDLDVDRDARLAARLVGRERAAFLAAGLVEGDRQVSLYRDVATGRRSLRDLTRAEYDEWNIEWLPGESGLSPGCCIIFGGWIPIGILAIVAGIVVGFISGDWSQFLVTALGGTVLGYVAAIVAVTTYLVLDDRWLRLGQQVSAAYVVFLSVGSAVPLLVAVLMLVRA